MYSFAKYARFFFPELCGYAFTQGIARQTLHVATTTCLRGGIHILWCRYPIRYGAIERNRSMTPDEPTLIDVVLSRLSQLVQLIQIPELPDLPEIPELPEFTQFTQLPQLPELSALLRFIQSPHLTPFYPVIGWLLIAIIVLLVLRAPHPLRGPRTRRRDSQRGYKFALRNDIMESAGYRCESPRFVAWGRCPADATQVDHIYPWSRGGPTTRSNGQALCAEHNREKSATTPPWWYVVSLEHRRRIYYPTGTRVRVQGNPRRRSTNRKRTHRARSRN